jgi:hypothetical protein
MRQGKEKGAKKEADAAAAPKAQPAATSKEKGAAKKK